MISSRYLEGIIGVAGLLNFIFVCIFSYHASSIVAAVIGAGIASTVFTFGAHFTLDFYRKLECKMNEAKQFSFDAKEIMMLAPYQEAHERRRQLQIEASMSFLSKEIEPSPSVLIEQVYEEVVS